MVNPIMAAMQQSMQPSSSPTTQSVATTDNTQAAIENAQRMMQQFKMAANPMQMLAQNPSYQRAMQRIQAATNPKQAFYNRARELGVDPDQFIQQLKGGM